MSKSKTARKSAPAILKTDAPAIAPLMPFEHRTAREMRKRVADLKGNGARDDAISAECQRAIIQLVTDGCTLSEIAELAGMPNRFSIFKLCERDAEFRAAMDKARTASALSEIDTSHASLKDAMQSDDIDRIRGAAIYAEQTRAYAAKIAPREFGELVKIAGADGGALSVTVTNYGELGAPEIVHHTGHMSRAIDTLPQTSEG